MTLYATGVRRAELTHLKVSDIDSQRMVIHVQGGKGRKDRDVLLSPTTRGTARALAPGLPRKPSAWLFPGNRWHTGDTPITTKVTSGPLARLLLATSRPPEETCTPHTLRHCPAHTSTGSRRGSTNHPDIYRASRSGRNHHFTSISLNVTSNYDRKSSGLAGVKRPATTGRVDGSNWPPLEVADPSTRQQML